MASDDSASQATTPAALAAQYDTQQLVAIATDCAPPQDDALWSACVLELAARCDDPIVAQDIAAAQVRRVCVAAILLYICLLAVMHIQRPV